MGSAPSLNEKYIGCSLLLLSLHSKICIIVIISVEIVL